MDGDSRFRCFYMNHLDKRNGVQYYGSESRECGGIGVGKVVAGRRRGKRYTQTQ